MKKLFFALPFLLAGCQSERVAFQFQPAAPAVRVVPAGAAAAQPVAATSEVVEPGTVAAAQAPPADFSKAETLTRTRRNTKKRLHQLAAGRPDKPLAAPVVTGQASLASTPARLELPGAWALRRLVRQHATAGPARTAESGLGNIGLFFIAVVLGILAGLGALVALIPGVSFLGGVGLAAAGLVVLFLLYSLLSGSKKK